LVWQLWRNKSGLLLSEFTSAIGVLCYKFEVSICSCFRELRNCDNWIAELLQGSD
jgi:hypothetical protein